MSLRVILVGLAAVIAGGCCMFAPRPARPVAWAPGGITLNGARLSPEDDREMRDLLNNYPRKYFNVGILHCTLSGVVSEIPWPGARPRGEVGATSWTTRIDPPRRDHGFRSWTTVKPPVAYARMSAILRKYDTVSAAPTR